MDTLIADITNEFAVRVAREEELLNDYVDGLKQLQREAEAKFVKYRSEIDVELGEAIS